MYPDKDIERQGDEEESLISVSEGSREGSREGSGESSGESSNVSDEERKDDTSVDLSEFLHQVQIREKKVYCDQKCEKLLVPIICYISNIAFLL